MTRPLRPASGALLAALIALGGTAQAQAFHPGPKIGPPPAQKAGAVDPRLAAAIASPDRPAADKARDVFRHPAQTLAFWGLRPGMTVVDLQPGGGYWTYILAPYLKATGGRYIAGGSERGRAGFMAKFGDGLKFGKVEYVVFDKSAGPVLPAGSVDMVITSRELHNWIGGGYFDRAMKASFDVLKPGGIFAVEEHRADPKPQLPDAGNGYVAVKTAVDGARRAGFRFEDASEINANPRDTKDYPFGVWTLPPTRTSTEEGKPPLSAADRAKDDAIGESDRMTLRFRKP
ncbi:MAG: class I SAM-dependent methyltransferase [Caulobacteraceae bacterium]|nr:class I SAM-dependent methyltransferase [Caulobacter sp.]